MKAVNAALQQIEDKQYALKLKQRGIENIIKLAIVFDGKRVLVSDKPVNLPAKKKVAKKKGKKAVAATKKNIKRKGIKKTANKKAKKKKK